MGVSNKLPPDAIEIGQTSELFTSIKPLEPNNDRGDHSTPAGTRRARPTGTRPGPKARQVHCTAAGSCLRLHSSEMGLALCDAKEVAPEIANSVVGAKQLLHPALDLDVKAGMFDKNNGWSDSRS